MLVDLTIRRRTGGARKEARPKHHSRRKQTNEDVQPEVRKHMSMFVYLIYQIGELNHDEQEYHERGEVKKS
jgi:hypothetical protein